MKVRSEGRTFSVCEPLNVTRSHGHLAFTCRGDVDTAASCILAGNEAAPGAEELKEHVP